MTARPDHDATVEVRASDLQALRAAAGRIASDVARARSLARDAIQRLFGTFQQLKAHLDVECVRYQDAIAAISGANGNRGLVASVREVIERFVADIIRLGKSSVQIQLEIETLRGHAELVAKRGARIETIAHTTRVISLNARIEAQRFGEGGAVFRVVADEIKKLAHEADELSRQIRAAIQQQARSLDVTGAAASDLSSTDLQVAVASNRELEETINRMADVSRTSEHALSQIRSDVEASIQALQFEDMLDQLLAAVGAKLHAMEATCGALAEGKDPGQALARVEADAVTQQDLSTGSVELF